MGCRRTKAFSVAGPVRSSPFVLHAKTEDSFLFASEIKALLACPDVECKIRSAGTRSDFHILGHIAAAHCFQEYKPASARAFRRLLKMVNCESGRTGLLSTRPERWCGRRRDASHRRTSGPFAGRHPHPSALRCAGRSLPQRRIGFHADHSADGRFGRRPAAHFLSEF